MAARTVGPAFGYMLGSACLTIYADPKNLPVGMTDNSPNWVGAWWIGFIVIGNFKPHLHTLHAYRCVFHIPKVRIKGFDKLNLVKLSYGVGFIGLSQFPLLPQLPQSI